MYFLLDFILYNKRLVKWSELKMVHCVEVKKCSIKQITY